MGREGGDVREGRLAVEVKTAGEEGGVAGDVVKKVVWTGESRDRCWQGGWGPMQ